MITVKEISTPKELKQFIKFAWQIYRNDDNWVPPLIGDMLGMLDKKKGAFFEIGEAAYFMAFEDGKPVGRISAHINRMHNDIYKTKDGYFGFYEAVEKQEVAGALLKAAEDWCRNKGMNKIIGQENFTIYDEMGFMIKGWDAIPSTPVILETYTPKYYIQQMEAAGYQKEIDWIAFLVKDDYPLKDVWLKIKDRIIQRRGLTFRNVNLKKLPEEIEKLKVIFRDAWQGNWEHFPMTDHMFEKIAEALKVIVNPKLCFMVEDHGAPVACSITLPDINPFVKKMNGRLFPFGIFHLLAGKKKAKGVRTFMMGVLPPYRNIGIDVAMVIDTFIAGRKIGIKYSECSLIEEHNTKMIEPIVKWGGDPYKVYRLFSKGL